MPRKLGNFEEKIDEMDSIVKCFFKRGEKVIEGIREVEKEWEKAIKQEENDED